MPLVSLCMSQSQVLLLKSWALKLSEPNGREYLGVINSMTSV